MPLILSNKFDHAAFSSCYSRISRHDLEWWNPILRFGQIQNFSFLIGFHQPLWSGMKKPSCAFCRNTFCNLEKYSLQFGQWIWPCHFFFLLRFHRPAWSRMKEVTQPNSKMNFRLLLGWWLDDHDNLKFSYWFNSIQFNLKSLYQMDDQTKF